MVSGHGESVMRIIIETIPHADQRYETVGDFFVDNKGVRRIVVSEMGNEDYEFLVAIHELIEAKLCEKAGISDEAITAFDVKFESDRKPDDVSEPGDEPLAPYARQHCIATAVERLMCAELGIAWMDYEMAVQRLSK